MRRIAHISDLHFGTESLALAKALTAELNTMKPHLVVVSGDLTQRARRRQFMAAAEFLRRLPGPQLVVPGNHDIPLFDVVHRFIAPLRRYRKWIAAEVDPIFTDEEMRVVGVNTARSLTWKNGRISHEQINALQRQFCDGQRCTFRVVVTHHPFIPPPDIAEGSVKLVGRARDALRILDACEVDLLLAGHLHHGYTGDVRVYHPATRRSIIVAQAGTAISRRIRSQPNAYNLITLERERMTISPRVWQQGQFTETTRSTYVLHQEEWLLEKRSA